MNIGFVPIRSGSKGIKHKNIKIINGKPLVYWILNAMENCKEIDKYYVAIDSIHYKKVISMFNFKKIVFFNRSKKNSTDKSSSESVLVEFLEKEKIDKNSNIIFCQATSPMTSSKDISGAIKLFDNSSCDSLLSVVENYNFFWDQKQRSAVNYDPSKRPRRQDHQPYYQENGAIYINSCKNIIKYKNRISGKIGFYVMSNENQLEIDDDVEFKIIEKLLSEKYKKIQSKNFIRLFVSDIDGTLTDGGMYYSESGEALKKFNTRDGMGFELLKKNNIKTALITSENSKINKKRAQKLNIDYLIQGERGQGKLNSLKKLCSELKITLDQCAYIGDDINCKEILEEVRLKAAPKNASAAIRSIAGIHLMKSNGGDGAVREFIETIIKQ